MRRQDLIEPQETGFAVWLEVAQRTNFDPARNRLRPRELRFAHRESGSCRNPQTFYLDRIEEAVLSGLRAELVIPM